MNFFQSPIFLVQFLFVIIYLLLVIAIIYWMVKILKNSNETVRLQKEILEQLKRKE
ncbi:MAG: hypothetical protein JST62_01800 [Bacteroidetes bacterium]|nr:hypothetical protein [Bacteroidota bacterium]